MCSTNWSDGIDFELAWVNKTTVDFGGVPASFIGIDELIANKKAAARPQDLRDVRTLERLKLVRAKQP